MATSAERIEVGVRDLKNGLSRYIDRVKAGTEVTVTEHGRPVARLMPLDSSTARLHDLIAAGLVRRPAVTERRLPRKRVAATGSVSALVAEQRR